MEPSRSIELEPSSDGWRENELMVNSRDHQSAMSNVFLDHLPDDFLTLGVEVRGRLIEQPKRCTKQCKTRKRDSSFLPCG